MGNKGISLLMGAVIRQHRSPQSHFASKISKSMTMTTHVGWGGTA